MAHVDLHHRPAAPLRELFGAVAAAVAGFAGEFARATRAAADAERLSRRTDADLAREGLTRAAAYRALMDRHYG